MTEHYLDNSSTTRPSAAAIAALERAIAVWGNPSSVHSLGQGAASLLRDSRKAVAKSLGMPPIGADKLFFTSSGTESNNIALTGSFRAKKRDPKNAGTVIISAGEHPSIDGPAAALEREGVDVVRVPTVGGVLDLEYLKNALESARSPVFFAGFMLVNNETGAVYDVKSAATLVKSYYPDAVVHCDAVQGYMKMKFTPYTLGVDTLSVSAHKIHSFRGAAALYVSADVIKRKNIVPVMYGGGQEEGFRSGTENLASIATFASAAEEGRVNLADNIARVESLRERLDEALSALDVRFNRPVGKSLPNICSVILPQIKSETMLNYLSGRWVYVSAGSACAASSKKKSAALMAFGAADSDIDSTIRVSLSHTSTYDDIDAFAVALSDGIASLQRIGGARRGRA